MQLIKVFFNDNIKQNLKSFSALIIQRINIVYVSQGINLKGINTFSDRKINLDRNHYEFNGSFYW